MDKWNEPYSITRPDWPHPINFVRALEEEKEKEPKGKITITENGTNIDIAVYATADINVPTSTNNVIFFAPTGTAETELWEIEETELYKGNIVRWGDWINYANIHKLYPMSDSAAEEENVVWTTKTINSHDVICLQYLSRSDEDYDKLLLRWQDDWCTAQDGIPSDANHPVLLRFHLEYSQTEINI